MEFDQTTILLLLAAPNAPELSDAAAREIQQAHLDHQSGLARQGFVLTAGPFGDRSNELYRGMSVLSVDAATALELYSNDPAVKAGLMTIEAFTWYRPKGTAEFHAVQPES